MSTFPSSLPKPLISGYSETPPELTVRTDMDAGVAKVRKRFSDGSRQIKMSYVMTDAQLTTLETFYLDTVEGGSLSFTMENPRTDTNETFRFLSQPSYSMISHNTYNVSVDYEQIP